MRVVLENPDHAIKSSASAVIMVSIGESQKIKLVPKDSIVSSPGVFLGFRREGRGRSPRGGEGEGLV